MQQQQIQHQQIQHQQIQQQQIQQQQQIPIGKPPVANMSSVDEISKVLASMNSQDLFTLMSQMKVISVIVRRLVQFLLKHSCSKCRLKGLILQESF